MKELISPFQNRHKLKIMIVCVLVFIGMAVPFKVMVLIEGFTEVRPVNAVPIVVGLLFGPAGAWGCAFGNLFADFFGTFSKASILGFVGNFLAAYLPYKFWYLSKRSEAPNAKSLKNILKYIAIATIGAAATAILIASGLDVVFNNWMPQVFWIIFFNDLGFSLFLGLPVLIVLTSEDSRVRIILPEPCQQGHNGEKRLTYFKYALCLTLVVSEGVLLSMIGSGMQMTESTLMAITGGIFLTALVGVTTTPSP